MEVGDTHETSSIVYRGNGVSMSPRVSFRTGNIYIDP